MTQLCCISEWMHDVAFYSTNFLICATTTQLYQLDDQSEEQGGDDFCLRLLFDAADSHLRAAIDRPDGDVSGE